MQSPSQRIHDSVPKFMASHKSRLHSAAEVQVYGVHGVEDYVASASLPKAVNTVSLEHGKAALSQGGTSCNSSCL